MYMRGSISTAQTTDNLLVYRATGIDATTLPAYSTDLHLRMVQVWTYESITANFATLGIRKSSVTYNLEKNRGKLREERGSADAEAKDQRAPSNPLGCLPHDILRHPLVSLHNPLFARPARDDYCFPFTLTSLCTPVVLARFKTLLLQLVASRVSHLHLALQLSNELL